MHPIPRSDHDAAPHQHSRLGLAVIVASWVLFLVSLVVPAIELDAFEPEWGAACLGWSMSLPLGLKFPLIYSATIANPILYLGPLIWFTTAGKVRIAFAILMSAEVIFARLWARFDFILHPGYYLWLGSIILFSASLWVSRDDDPRPALERFFAKESN